MRYRSFAEQARRAICTIWHDVAFEVNHTDDEWIVLHNVVSQALHLDVWSVGGQKSVEENDEKRSNDL